MCVCYEKSLLNRKVCSQREISMKRESEVLELNERESQNRRERALE